MRIGVYLENISPEAGGGFTFQDEVLKALLRQVVNAPQHEFYIICTSYSLGADPSDLQPLRNLSFILLKKPNFLEVAIEWLKKGSLTVSRIIKWEGPLERLSRKTKLDLVWFVGGGCFEILDTPYVATVWDLQHRLQPYFPEVSAAGVWAGRELQYRYFLSRASYVIVGTEAGSSEVEMFYQIPKFRICKLPHPTPSFALYPLNPDGLNVHEKYDLPQNYIFYPAQFWPHKNHINLLNAIKIISEKYSVELPLVFVGSDKGNADYVRHVANSLGMSKQCHILGFVPQSDLYGLYKQASMLAYVSLCGPENLPPLEAFAVGCPVVVSDVMGSQEQFGDAVLYCNPKDANDIANKIYKVFLDDSLKQDLISKGHLRAKSWTSDDFVKGFFKVADDFSAIRKNWKS